MQLTDKVVRDLPAPDRGMKIFYDDKISGFGVRITATGFRSYVLRYRTRTGFQRTETIGSTSTWTVVAARTRAVEIKRAVDSGSDPVANRQADIAAPDMRSLCERFEQEHMPRLRPATAKEYGDLIEKEILPKLGALKVASVSFNDIDKLHRKMTERAPYRSNKCLALLSKMFSLAIQWKWRDTTNPCKGISKNVEEPRERYLTQAELVALLDALDNYHDQQIANIIRLLLLTGARNSEVFKAKWSQFDLEAGTWTKKSAHTKQRKLHHTPLNKPALALLRQVHESRSSSEYLFSNPDTGKPYTTLKKSWATIRKSAGISDLRLYDSRHSFASTLINSKVELSVIGKLLGHTQHKTTLRYSHLYTDTLKEAVAKAGKAFEDAQNVSVLRRK